MGNSDGYHLSRPPNLSRRPCLVTPPERGFVSRSNVRGPNCTSYSTSFHFWRRCESQTRGPSNDSVRVTSRSSLQLRGLFAGIKPPRPTHKYQRHHDVIH